VGLGIWIDGPTHGATWRGPGPDASAGVRC